MRLDPLSFMLATGVMYVAMPVTVWVLLRHRHPRLNLNLWCGGGLLVSATFVLYALRAELGPVWSIQLANACGYLAAVLGFVVLRMEAGHRPPWGVAFAAFALPVAITLAAAGAPAGLRAGLVNLLHGLLAGLLAHAANEVARVRDSRSARVMTLLYAMMCLVLLVRAVTFPLWLQEILTGPPQWAYILPLLGIFGGGVSANIGYIGLALDRARASAREQRQALDTLRETQSRLELAARTREAVASERARTTRVLAHEVRQPLHNAAVALQSGLATLARSRDAEEVTRAIQQAQAVIRRVSATLDNTVAATTLLTGEGRISTADADLQVLIDLCLGDLPPESRARVRIDYLADARSARLEPSLTRLALRNLLANATLYSPPEAPVILRVLDSDDPLALVFEVADLGPGIPDALRERIFDEGVRGGQPTVPGYGLGLHVVKRVTQMHGGSIDWRPNLPQGSIFSLTLPQGDPA